MIVLRETGVGAFAAADATGEIQRVTKLYAIERLKVAQGGLNAVFLPGFGSEVVHDAPQVFGGELAVMLLQQLIQRDRATLQFEQRLERRHQTRHAHHRSRGAFQERPARHRPIDLLNGPGTDFVLWFWSHGA